MVKNASKHTFIIIILDKRYKYLLLGKLELKEKTAWKTPHVIEKEIA